MSKKVRQINEDDVKKVLCVIKPGLSNGLGEPIPGEMCVEAAVYYALYGGYEAPKDPYGDKYFSLDDHPSCVASFMADDKIALNDTNIWKDNKDRAKGLKRAAIAQLGSTHVRIAKYNKVLGEKLNEYFWPDIIRSFILDKILANQIVSWMKTPKTKPTAISVLEKFHEDEDLRYLLYDPCPSMSDLLDQIEGSYALDKSRLLKLLAECFVQACIDLDTQGSYFLHLVK